LPSAFQNSSMIFKSDSLLQAFRKDSSLSSLVPKTHTQD
jgi:hypothetical protein